MAQTFQILPGVSSIWDRETPVEDFEAELSAAETIVEEEKSLPELVEDYRGGDRLGEQGRCLATAIYFEARGEDLEGQLAVADVVMNRAESEKYPSTWCNVVKQRAQFSFVQNRRFPSIREGQAWETAKAVARVAINEAHEILPEDVLWYHADYVRPSWGRRLDQVTKVGVHIFYR